VVRDCTVSPLAPPHPYETVGLDRAVHLRRDPARLHALRTAAESRILLLHRLRVPVISDRRGTTLALRPLAPPLPEPCVFLGLRHGRAIFAAARDEPPPGVQLAELRALAPVLPRAELGLAALARALLHWHETHRFCGRCGAATGVHEGGHLRRCPACGLDIHPRTDPAVIVLVHDGDRCLLGRAPHFPAGMYSTLAGFVEPGESPEAAVAREVFEECGIEVAEPVYVSAQPWPFPQSLMLGFFARARTHRLRIDREELMDARWFTRAELADPARRPVHLPRGDSIARYLIERWLAGSIPRPGGGSSS